MVRFSSIFLLSSERLSGEDERVQNGFSPHGTRYWGQRLVFFFRLCEKTWKNGKKNSASSMFFQGFRFFSFFVSFLFLFICVREWRFFVVHMYGDFFCCCIARYMAAVFCTCRCLFFLFLFACARNKRRWFGPPKLRCVRDCITTTSSLCCY